MVIYGGLWFAVTASFPSMPFDSYEMFLFGKEMQWGYWKHPPLEPFLTEMAYRLTGGWIQSHFVLAIGSILLTFYFVWRLGREIVGETGAVIAVALNILCFYFTHPITMYSHNVGQLPFWAATVYFYRRAVLGNAMRDWIVLGVLFALLLYSKYAGALLLIVLAGHMLLTAEGRRLVFTPGPWFAAVLGAVLMVPNLVWLVQHDFIPFTFAFDRTPVFGLAARALAAIKFVLSQIGFHAAPIVILILAAFRVAPYQGDPVALEFKRPSAFDRSLVLSTAILPILIIAVLTFIASTDQRSEIAGSLVALSGLAMVVLLPQRPVLRSPRLVTFLWMVALVGFPVGQVVSVYVKPYYGGLIATAIWPARDLSAAMDDIWMQHTAKPLDIVTGDYPNAGMVALYIEPRPSVFIAADFRKSPWVTPERLQRNGTLVMWLMSQYPKADELPQPYQDALGGLKAQFGTYDLKLGYNGRHETYGWAVLLPQ
ncbi:MAG: glycosyltransferase family 39 protein [Xanthobacteraceae bacterium]|nr:glycosyltransferase family 39 protein [Xanthobacteraceae bacterium]